MSRRTQGAQTGKESVSTQVVSRKAVIDRCFQEQEAFMRQDKTSPRDKHIADLYYTCGMIPIKIRLLGTEKWFPCVCYVDGGANVSHMSKQMAEKIGLKWKHLKTAVVGTAAGEISEEYVQAYLEVTSYNGKDPVEVISIRAIKNYHRSKIIPINTSRYPPLRGIDFGPRIPGTACHLTLGTNCYAAHADRAQVNMGPGNPQAHESHLGWYLSGAVEPEKTYVVRKRPVVYEGAKFSDSSSPFDTDTGSDTDSVPESA